MSHTKFSLILLLPIALVATLLACSPKPSASSTSMALSKTANDIIVPWYAAFESSSASLYKHLERFCQNPSNQGELTASKNAWQATMMDWQQVQVIQFGPISEGNQNWKIQFWPDSHNRVGRKVNELLNSDSPITVETLKNSVVLVQGLSAIEYMLFDPQNAAIEVFNNPKTCEFLLASSQLTQEVAASLARGWQPEGGNFLATLLSPGTNNPHFSTEQDAIAVILEAMVSSLENIKAKKIGEAFKGKPSQGKFNPYKLELWRSGLSLEAMTQNIESVEQLFQTAIKPVLKAKQADELVQQTEKSLQSILTLVRAQKAPLFSELRNQENQPDWDTITQELKISLGLLKRDIPNFLSLQLGFNANDGD